MTDIKFIKFRDAVNKQFQKMAKGNLFRVDSGKDELWECYLDSFPEGTNPIFRENKEYDCNCCKSYIRAIGNVVSIKGGVMSSIWDVQAPKYFQIVADALAELVKSKGVIDKFLYCEKNVGRLQDKVITDAFLKFTFDHFCSEIPSTFVSSDIASKLGKFRSLVQVYERGLKELTNEAAETILDLISQKSLYRGEEHRNVLNQFVKDKRKFEELSKAGKDLFVWEMVAAGSVPVRNSVIGTLLIDLSEGMDLEQAVKSFEKKVAPENYQRPKKLVTKGMIDKAEKRVVELGLMDSLPRRHSTIEDITINNVIFADRSAKKEMNAFDSLKAEVPVSDKKFGKVEEISIDNFIKDVLPNVSSIDLFFDNKHKYNLVSLVSPINKEASGLFKWGSNFSWTYNGEVADSMKERVKRAGGNVEGVLRFSIQWNDIGNDQNDLDAHCLEPGNNLIYFENKGRIHKSSGKLDVDIVHPRKDVAVENIIHTDINKMPEGVYKMMVHNYSDRGGSSGFRAEIEFDGKVYSYDYRRNLRQDEKVQVAKVKYTKDKGFELIETLDHSESTQEYWGINTQNFHKVRVMMYSPNHWDENEIGNKHYFFMLEDCLNPDPVRGFFNEFLRNDLKEDRKVFEMLGSKMKAEYSDKQLSGLGFSSTKHANVLVKVQGNFTRTLKINF